MFYVGFIGRRDSGASPLIRSESGKPAPPTTRGLAHQGREVSYPGFDPHQVAVADPHKRGVTAGKCYAAKQVLADTRLKLVAPLR